MGFYSRVVFPRLCDFVLDRPLIAEQRRQAVASARGDVLEIGFGTGLNLPFYPADVRKLVAAEPNVGMHRLAQRRMKQAAILVEHRTIRGEKLPFIDDSFDCAVSTFTLCSIAPVEQAIAELFRVLRPSGRFLFLEHGLSREPAVQTWQRRLNPLQAWLADGCRLDRDMKRLVSAQPFSTVETDEYYLESTPRTHGYLYRGMAKKGRVACSASRAK